MPRPWAFLLAVIVTAITAAERIRVLLGGMPAKKHIAALPFAAIGSGEERQVFADGLTETVTSKLSELEQFQNALWVVPSSEVRARKLASVEGTRKAFGVTLVVTGTVRRDPNAITVATNLVVTRSLKQLRSRVVEVPVRSAAALEPRIVGSLSEMLGLILQPEARRLVSAGQTGNPDAYQSYQDALGYLRRFGQQNVARAIRLFHDAIAKDPQYALAFAPAGRGLLAHSCSVRTLLTPSSRSAT